MLGHLYQRVGQLTNAEQAYMKVLDLACTDQNNQAMGYGNLGGVHYKPIYCNKRIDKIFEAKRKGIILDNDVDVEAGERRIYARFCPNYDLTAN